MNGDLKVFDSKHTQLLSINMHTETSITDCLFFKSDVLNTNVVVSASEVPNPALTFSYLSNDRKSLSVVARAKYSALDPSEGITCLAQNPMTLEMIASSSSHGGDILLWNVDPSKWQSDEKVMENKRQKTGVATIDPTATLKCTHGTQSIKWISPETLVAGGLDHQLKVFDIQK